MYHIYKKYFDRRPRAFGTLLTRVCTLFLGTALLFGNVCSATPTTDSKPATLLPQETRGELWTGDLYSSKYKAGACIDKEGNVRGVLELHLKNGDIDVYHFWGQQDAQGVIRAKHSSGHRFEGVFQGEHVITGKVRTKQGFTVKLKGRRTQNVLLTETCGPISSREL